MSPRLAAVCATKTKTMNKLTSIFNLHLDDFKLTDFTTSPFISQIVLFFIRVFLALYVLIVFAVNWYYNDPPKQEFLFYLTNLSWFGIGLYFTMSSILTFLSLKKTTQIHKIFRFLIWNLYIIQTTYQWIVVAVFWALLSGYLLANLTPYNLFINVSVHGLGLVFMLFEQIFGSIPIYPSQWLMPIVVAVLYLAYTQFQHYVVDGNFFAYFFVNYRDNPTTAPIFTVGIFIAILIIFYLVVGYHKLRDHFRRRRMARTLPVVSGVNDE